MPRRSGSSRSIFQSHDRLGELVAEVLGVPRSIVRSMRGLRGQGPGSDGHVVEAPAVVLNGLMEITRAGRFDRHSRPLRDR